MTKPHLLELPPDVELLYLAEGGANVVYRFTTVPAVPGIVHRSTSARESVDPTHSTARSGVTLQHLQGKLLRLRKDTAFSTPYEETTRNFDTIIRPLFEPEELVDQTLVRLPVGLVQDCNDQLRAAERAGTRPRKRHGIYLSVQEPFGLLITDMTTLNDPGFVLAELKPKWLVQSPTAPPNAHRCRTCALREMKNHEAHLAGLDEQKSFCPLDLVSDKPEHVLRASRLVKGCKDPVNLARILYRNSTLLKLQAHQKRHGNVGLLGPSGQAHEKSLAMTLRDCTVYIKVPVDGRGEVEIRLGDLDLKTTAGAKAAYWLGLEEKLRRGGWYAATNPCQEPSNCSLREGPRP